MKPVNVTLIALAVGAALLFAAYRAGYGAGYNKGQAEELAAVERVIEQQNAIAEENREVMEGYYEGVAEREAKIKVIEKEVVKYVQSRADDPVCLDADGLRLWNE